MYLTRFSAVLLVAVLTSCGTSPAAPTALLAVTPTSATLAVGQSQVFELTGGREPVTVQVMGCLGGATSCVLYNLADAHVGDVRAPFTLERLGPRRVRVTFVDATLRPVKVRLDVFEAPPDVSTYGAQVHVDLALLY